MGSNKDSSAGQTDQGLAIFLVTGLKKIIALKFSPHACFYSKSSMLNSAMQKSKPKKPEDR